jgi:proline iminopeptidase
MKKIIKVTCSNSRTLPKRKLYVEYHPAQVINAKHYPSIICLPGGPGGTHEIYKDHIEPLTHWANVIVFDPRGCGQSDACSNQEYDINVYTQDLESIRKHFKLNQWILLGTSYGTMAALSYATQYEAQISGLILVNGAASSHFIELAKKEVLERGSIEQQKMFDDLLKGKVITDKAMQDYFRVMGPLYSVKPGDNSSEMKVKCNPIAATAGLGPNGFLHRFNVEDKLQTIQCPTLVIVGEKDFINPPQMARRIHQGISHSEFHLLDGGHVVWEDNKDEYYQLIGEFLKNQAIPKIEKNTSFILKTLSMISISAGLLTFFVGLVLLQPWVATGGLGLTALGPIGLFALKNWDCSNKENPSSSIKNKL